MQARLGSILIGGLVLLFCFVSIEANAATGEDIGLEISGDNKIFAPGDVFDVIVSINPRDKTVIGITHFIGFDDSVLETNNVFSFTEGKGVGCEDDFISSVPARLLYATNKLDAKNYSFGHDGDNAYFRIDRMKLFCGGVGYDSITSPTDVYKIQFKVKEIEANTVNTVVRVLDTSLNDGVDSKNADKDAVDRAVNPASLGSVSITINNQHNSDDTDEHEDKDEENVGVINKEDAILEPEDIIFSKDEKVDSDMPDNKIPQDIETKQDAGSADNSDNFNIPKKNENNPAIDSADSRGDNADVFMNASMSFDTTSEFSDNITSNNGGGEMSSNDIVDESDIRKKNMLGSNNISIGIILSILLIVLYFIHRQIKKT